jgi:hypothetical protein
MIVMAAARPLKLEPDRTIGRPPAFTSIIGVTAMTKMPPTPAENRSTKGVGSDPELAHDQKPPARENLAEQGRQGNIKQNTRNQGHQQDR